MTGNQSTTHRATPEPTAPAAPATSVDAAPEPSVAPGTDNAAAPVPVSGTAASPAATHQQTPEGIRDILDCLRAGVAAYRIDGEATTVVAVNDYLCEMLETTREEFLARGDHALRDLVHPDDHDVIDDLLGRLTCPSGCTADARFRLMAQVSGRAITFQVRASNYPQPDGTHLIYLVFIDVSEQRASEDEYNRNIQTLLQANPAVRCAFHLNLTKNVCNEKAGAYEYTKQLMDAVTADELLANLASIIVDQKDADTFREDFSRERLLACYESGERQFSIVYRRLTESGRTLWVKTFFQLMFNPATGDVETVAYTEDYEREHIDEMIIALIAGTDYEAIGIVDLATHDVTYYMNDDEEGHITALVDGSFEERARELYDNTPSHYEMERLKSQLTVPGIVKRLEHEPIVAISFQFKGLHEELRYRYLDASKERLLFTRRDITQAVREKDEIEHQIREALEAAEKASAAKTAFISRISHDIRTPIGAILNLTDFAIDDIDDTPKLRRDLANIQASGTFLLSLINDVLDISKMDSDKIELTFEPYDYREFLNEVTSLMRPMCAEKGLTFQARTEEPLAANVVMADKVRLRQVVLNVLSNAVKFTPEGGTVRQEVTSRRLDDGRVAFDLRVIDTGIGMSAEFVEHLFEDFAQETDNPERVATSSGTGLGMAIAKHLMDLMGGTIDVESERGKGTTVTLGFVFDVAEEDEQDGMTNDGEDASDADGDVAAEDSAQKPRVLLVEDNEINAMIAQRIFEEMGVDAERAADGRLGLERFEAAQPDYYDAIFMDIQMPNMNGYEATSAIRALPRPDAQRIPIIAMTADAFEDARKRAMACGMDRYMTKPIEVDEVHAAIDDVMAGTVRVS